MKNDIWGIITIEKSECLAIHFGSNILYLKKYTDTIKTCIETSHNKLFNRKTVKISDLENHDFKSFYTTEEHQLAIRQSYLSKSILVSPLEKRALMPRESIETFVQLPSAMELVIEKKKEKYVLLHIPSEFIPDAWFGDENGEPCYLLKTDFTKLVDKENYTPNHIYCPLTLTNASEEVLDLEKFILRTPHYKLYQNEEGILYSDQVHIKFRGNGLDSIISLDEPKPLKFGKLSVVSGSYMPYAEQLIKKSFDFIRFIH